MAKTVKPAAAKATRSRATAPDKKKDTGYKYSDKSAGQPELVPVFDQLHALISQYEKGTLEKRGGTGGQVALVITKPVVVDGRSYPEMHFAAALIQKGYVGFYFMPVYNQPGLKETLPPALNKLLKGKACYHIKQTDEVILAHIRTALETGYQAYKKAGWVD
jgi:hypothetical protein